MTIIKLAFALLVFYLVGCAKPEQTLVSSQKLVGVKDFDLQKNRWNEEYKYQIRVYFTDGETQLYLTNKIYWAVNERYGKNYICLNHYQNPESKVIEINLARNDPNKRCQNEEWE
jgi:hypothetical protein